MLRSPAVLATLFLFTCFMWGVYVILVTLPVYFSSVLKFSAQQTGAVFSCVVCVRLLGALVWTLVGNTLVSKQVLTYSTTKKMCLCLGIGGAGCAYVAVAFLQQTSKWTAVVCTMIGLVLQSSATSFLGSVPQDLAPRYAGTLLSMSMTVALLVALTAPLMVSALTPKGLYTEWRVVWLVLSAVNISGCLVFLVFGKTKIQTWALVTSGEEKDKELKTEPGKDVNQHLLEPEPESCRCSSVTAGS
ncbi:vesicular glutamate transporter 2.2 [Elysia marginata]|uniref:Vesicular glutamate transporter 2.2 n=1 Tax=Elysia marginata TaxID=1093978 RepID=A0AAV4HIH4_9GAST|nr:vesicular glutamate transporter 2.2 [Elysia marginata]